MRSNQIKLLLISVCLCLISGYFFWLGFTGPSNEVVVLGLENTPLPSESLIPKPSLEPSDASLIIEEKVASGSAVSKFRNPAKVERVVDGDTIEVLIDGKKYKLRLIGVNTPETVDPRRGVQCFGKEASNETKRILSGQTVFLEKDISETDKFGRLLRYVYLSLDTGEALFVNDYLVRQGFAQADTYPPDVKFSAQFVEAQKEAKAQNKGLWSKCKEETK